jgi:opacity protein-like surface antigen
MYGIERANMLKSLLIALAALMVLPATASADEVDENELHPDHPHYRVVRRRRVVVVRPPRRPPPRRRLVVVDPPRERRRDDTLGLGLRFSGTGLDGQKIGLSDFENPGLVGFGLQLRSKVSHRWGLELSADYLTSTEGDSGFEQSTVPVMLSALFHLFPDSPIDVYGLAGAGVHFTTLSYMDGLFEHHILELAAQLGGGVQIKLWDSFALHADLRLLTVYKNLGTTSEVSHRCLQSKAGTTGYCDGLANLDPDDKFNIGAQFQAGATYYF